MPRGEHFELGRERRRIDELGRPGRGLFVFGGRKHGVTDRAFSGEMHALQSDAGAEAGLGLAQV
jgi:hypothetical protein